MAFDTDEPAVRFQPRAGDAHQISGRLRDRRGPWRAASAPPAGTVDRVPEETGVRYRSGDEDSDRWVGFPFREGDIVISTRSKSGTTWIQMICALLVFQTPELPAPLGELSPWLDWLVSPRDEVLAALAAQEHRRFIKTHTPLDGLPIDARATYIVAARHPLDMAVSLYHQGDNLDRARLRLLIGGGATPDSPPARPPLHDWLVAWIDGDASPQEQLDSLPGVMWHLSDAWSRRDAAERGPRPLRRPVR